MRGKDVDERSSRTDTGITPAYAGKSFAFRLGGGGIRDHPRLCGEKNSPLLQSLYDTGSPPPMRGKASGSFGDYAKFRITPAYAGKSSSRFI